MGTTQQSLANHTRLDPLYHFFLLPVAGLNFVFAFVALVRKPEVQRGWQLILAFALVLALLKMRLYSMKVQDRVIRLEERLRLAGVLPPNLRDRIPELSESQLIAIRFASDSELPDLVSKTLAEKLSNQEIKKNVRTWRADQWRV